MHNVVLFPLRPSPDGDGPKARFDIGSMTLRQLEDLRDALAALNEALQTTNALARARSRLTQTDEPA